MRFSGVLPPDAPEPGDERSERVRALPFPIYGLVPQRSLEEHDPPGLTEMGGTHGPMQMSVAITYTLWRNPDDQDDPVNLAEYPEHSRAALYEEPPWPRPRWLVAHVKRMRYRTLSEAVRTTWTREPWEYATLPNQLVHHVNHILMNHFRAELGLPDGPPSGPPHEEPWQARLSAVNPHARVEIDGSTLDAIEIDTDPFVYGIGAQLSPETVVTVVIPRVELPHVRIALARR